MAFALTWMTSFPSSQFVVVLSKVKKVALLITIFLNIGIFSSNAE